MTTTLARPEAAQEVSAGPELYLWTRAKYEEAVNKGLFTTDDKIELIQGRIMQKMSQKTPHTVAFRLMEKALSRLFLDGYDVRGQLPLTLDDLSQPEPDLAVVLGSPRDYLNAQPTAAQSVLVVEVSDTTLRFDQTRKAAVYARAGVADYWIVNLPERVLEVRRAPVGDAYAETLRLASGASVAPLAAPAMPLDVADLLP